MAEEHKFAMRSPKITTITQEEYTTKYLPEIVHAIMQILDNPEHLHFSQEGLLRAIYNVCCQRHSALLYSDIIRCVQNHLLQLVQYLASIPDIQFLPFLVTYIQKFKKTVAVLQQLCRYLERVYVVDKFGTPLNILFLTAFNQIVIHNPQQKPRLVTLLHNIPAATDPTLCMALAKELYSLDKENTALCLKLFSLYIPSLQATHTLEHDIQETHFFIQQLTGQNQNQNQHSNQNQGLNQTPQFQQNENSTTGVHKRKFYE